MKRNMIPTTGRRSAAAALGIALALSVAALPQAAQAGAKAYARFQYDDFVFTNVTDGVALRLGTDITISSFRTRTDHTAERGPAPDGSGGLGAGSDSTGGLVTSDTDPTDGVFVDSPMACVGPGCATSGGLPQLENDFEMGDFNTGEYVRSDSIVEGSGLDIGPAIGAPGPVVDTGSQDMVAEAITQAGAEDAGSSRHNNTTGFTITPTQDLTINLSFDAIIDLFAALHGGPDGAAPGSQADAATSTTITLTDNVTGLRVDLTDDNGTLGDLNQNVSTALPGGPPAEEPVSGPISVSLTTATDLIAGRQYSFNLVFQSTANLLVTKLPEPGALALLGMGLLGIGLRSRRRRTAV